jgi:thiol-disulfide isomerase/thioredoxin
MLRASASLSVPLLFCFALAAALLASPAAADPLPPTSPGQDKKDQDQDKGFPDAPPISVEWVKGGPVDLTKPNHIYVIELWATWCGPCVDGFPHLSALQRAHKGALDVVAISDEDPTQVQRFTEHNAAIMDFSVAVSEATSIRWGSDFRIDSIPAAFIMRNNKILWHGHPDSLDPILKAVTAGLWTPDTFTRNLNAESAAELYLSSLMSDAPPVGDVLEKATERLIEDARFSPDVLNMVAWIVLTEAPASARPPLPLLVRMAETADKASDLKNFNIADTLALALFESSQIPAAISTSERALSLCLAERSPSECAPIQESLTHYKARAPKATP